MPDKIIFTGTSSGQPSRDRATSSIVMQIDDVFYQLDAGEGFTGSALRNNIDLGNIKTIFITHTHSDHLVGLFMEIQYLYMQKREKELEIYLPGEAIEGVKSFLDLVYLFHEKLTFNVIFEKSKSGLFYSDDIIKVSGFRNNHLVHNENIIYEYDKPNLCRSYSFLIAVKGKRIFYTGDIGSIDDIKDYIVDVDILIAEGMHIDIEELVAICRDTNVGRLVVTHLPDEIFDKRDEIVAKSKALGFANIDVAYDGFAIEF